MGRIYLLIAGMLEIGWAYGLKLSSQGFQPLVWSATGAGMALSFAFLGLALRSLPLGTAYAAWTGIGSVGTVILGIALFAEPASAVRLGCVALILCGIVGLKLTT
jgi:quaternary ammonium compound-resistance protein SugE